jgi:3-phenylpropionate/trans-cinnamate dioxygenase ferredoxin reductase subunit
VTLLERGQRPLARFHPAVSTAAARALAEAGVRFLGDSRVQGIERGIGAGYVIGIEGCESVSADVVLTTAGVRSTLPPSLGEDGRAATDERLGLPGVDAVWVCGDVAAPPHPRYGRICVPHWDMARATGAHAARAVLGDGRPFVREPYWFSDIGRLRVQQLGLASAACEWHDRDGLAVGHDASGRPACVLLMNTPHRLAEARRLLAA